MRQAKEKFLAGLKTLAEKLWRFYKKLGAS
jgi:hypothetical protein